MQPSIRPRRRLRRTPMPTGNSCRNPSLLPDEDMQHLIVLGAFTAYVMHVTKCDQVEAAKRVATLCALTQQALGIK